MFPNPLVSEPLVVTGVSSSRLHLGATSICIRWWSNACIIRVRMQSSSVADAAVTNNPVSGAHLVTGRIDLGFRMEESHIGPTTTMSLPHP